jgi:hypothetical protein
LTVNGDEFVAVWDESIGIFTVSSVNNGSWGLGAASGDADCDGELTIADAVLILRAAIGLETLTPEALSAADIDGDGVLTMADALIAARRAVGVGV